MSIDLNCDMGESYGRWTLGADEELVQLVSSVNIACGLHGGDPATMRRTLQLAKRAGVAAGAHPSYPDLQGFGRRTMALTPEETCDWVLYQLGALTGFARAEGVELTHVKIHGALYNVAAQDAAQAAAIAKAIAQFSRDLILVGLAGSELVTAGIAAGLPVAREAFADRAYEADGSLRSRQRPGALLASPEVALAQVLSIVRDGFVSTPEGEQVAIQADTICIHGDTPGAVAFATRLREGLASAGVEVRALH